MRLLLVNLHFEPFTYGGATIVVRELAHRLAAAGHEVLVVCAMEDPELHDYELHRYSVGDVDVVALRPGRLATVVNNFDDDRMSERFRQILNAFRPDVVDFHAIQGLGVGCVEQAVTLGVPSVVTMHDAWWFCERQFRVRPSGTFCGVDVVTPQACAACATNLAVNARRQERAHEVLRGVDAVVAPSEYWADFVRHNGVPAERVHVSYNGVNHPRPGWRRPEHAGPVRFAYVGGNGAVKGSGILQDAFAGLDRSDYVLKVVDNEGNLGKSTVYETQWRVRGRLEFLPAYTQDDLDDVFGAVDVLLFPSQAKESYGLTPREALLRGAWVLASDCGGPVEHLRPGDNATVLPQRPDPAAWRAQIEAVLDDPAGHVPRVEVRIPTYDEQAADLERLYASLRAGRGTPAFPNLDPW